MPPFFSLSSLLSRDAASVTSALPPTSLYLPLLILSHSYVRIQGDRRLVRCPRVSPAPTRVLHMQILSNTNPYPSCIKAFRDAWSGAGLNWGILGSRIGRHFSLLIPLRAVFGIFLVVQSGFLIRKVISWIWSMLLFCL